MQYVNQYDSGAKCSSIGFNAERLFASLAKSRGYRVEDATKHENIYKHIDLKLYVFNPNKGHEDVISVDVKAQKKTNRNDSSFNSEWTWVEFRNVSGKHGWLLGEATHIAFERSGDFVSFPRKNLLRWVKQKIADENGGKITIKALSLSASGAKYKFYKRSGREDLLAQIKFSDAIPEIKGVQIWEKA
jgi:hypothetical protein